MPPKISSGNLYENKNVLPAPKNLEKALDFYEQSEFSQRFLGEKIHKHFLNIYRIESNLYNKVITDFELKRYFDQA